MSYEPRTSEVVIYAGDYLDRLRYLEQQYEVAAESEEQEPKRSGSKSEAARLAAEHAALKAEAEEKATRVRVGTVRRSVYRELADQHPPREGHDGDKALGVNAITFREALVPAAVVEVAEAGAVKAWADEPLKRAEPEGGDFTSEERVDFLDRLAESDMERLFVQAYGLVNGFTSTPKDLPSRTTSRPDES